MQDHWSTRLSYPVEKGINLSHGDVQYGSGSNILKGIKKKDEGTDVLGPCQISWPV